VNPAGRRRSVAAIALAALVLVALIIGAIALAGPGQVRLPSLRGLDRSKILARVRHLGLKPVFSDRHDSAGVGLAIAQAPAAGSLVDKGSVVQVTLSSGPPPVKLPSLVGQSSTSASAILHSLGLSARISQVPAPGVQPGTVTGQVPSAGRFVRSHSSVSLSAAETPRWRVLTAASGTDAGQSVPFRIRGTQWRITEQMNYVGTCTLLFYCDGPSAEVLNLGNGASLGQFDLSDGDSQMSPGGSGPGLYQVKVTPGSDTASWRIQVEDYY
jgi:beta-lactam-binding protein with PASTA domain